MKNKKPISERMKVYKKIKSHCIGVIEALESGGNLSLEDLEWIIKRMDDRLGPMMNKRTAEAIARYRDAANRLSQQREDEDQARDNGHLVDDLPF